MKRQNSVFKPIIATSLALALGVSVAVATDDDPKFYTQGSNGTQGTLISNPSNLTYGTATINSQEYATFQFGGTVDNEFKLYVHGSRLNWNASGFGNKGQLDAPSNSMLVSTKGIAMGDDGDGTLTLDMWTGSGTASQTKTFILDLSGVSSSSYAFYGNIDFSGSSDGGVSDYATKTANTTFGGKGIKGNLTFNSLANVNLVLEDTANIDGNLTINKGINSFTFGTSSTVTGTTTIAGGTNTINPTDHTVFQGAVTISGGTTTLLANTGNKSVNDLLGISTSAITLSGGTLALKFTDNVDNANKIFQLNTQNFDKITFSGTGALAFDGAKTVYFNNGTADNTGDGILNGNVKFIVDPSITTANDPSQAILKGSINGGASFSLKSSEGISGINPFVNPNADSSSLNTYYVDGSLAITGNFSTFWDDSKGFVGKIATTGADHSITFSSGLTGKNDAWFDKGTFTSGNNTISSIQATSGTSHLVFEDEMTIGSGSGNNAIYAKNASSMTLFKNNATINGNIWADTLGATTTNTLIFDKNATFTNTIIKSMRYDNAGANGTASNSVEIRGNASFTNSSIYAVSNTTLLGGFSRQNFIKFSGNVSGTITDLNANVSYTEGAGGYAWRAKNYLSFDNTDFQTLTITNINNTSEAGYNYIAKGLLTSNNGSLSVNGDFTNSTWSDDKYKANLKLISTNIRTKYGANYINVKELEVGDISVDINGTNNIIASGGTNSIATLTAKAGTNNIILGGTSNSITGNISATQGGGYTATNALTFNGSATINSSNIVANGNGQGNSINLISANGDLSFTNESGVQIQSIYTKNYLYATQRKNILTISGNISGTISDMTTARNTTADQNGYPTSVWNVLSLESSNEQSLTITSINTEATVSSNATGSTYIGKGFTTGSGTTLTLNSSIFASDSTDPWSGENHRANLNLTSDNIYNNSQATYINVKSLSGSSGGTNIKVSGGSINIIASGGNSNALGTITATSGTSNIVLKGTSNSLLGNISATGGSNIITSSTTRINNISISATRGVNNLTIDTLTEGSKIASMSISGDLNGRNNVTIKNSDLTIASGVTTSGAWNSNGQNNINLQKASATLTIESGGITTKKTSTEWYQDCVQQNNFIFSNGGNLTLTAGDISSQHYNQNNITFNGTNSGTITLSSGSIQATNNGRNNFFFSGSQNTINSSMTKNSGGQNNITYTANNATLTLQGATSQITNLTAYAPSSRSTNVSTLVIDGTNNANNTTIDNVINGSNLVAKFDGSNASTLKISAFAGNNNTLKAITLGDTSTNNTLDLTALTNTTITDAISVGASQGLNINLKDTTLTTSGWSNDEGGSSVINVGGNGVASANSTLQGGEVTLSGLTLQATNGASMTLQNSSTTIGTLTSSSTNGNKLILGFDSPDITTQTNNVSATINGAVNGSNLTLVFNGGEDRSTSLTLGGDENTIKAIQLGSNGTAQSTHNTLILNSGKTTITDKINVGTGNSTQALAFTLKDNTELALAGGLATGANGITTLDVVAGASATLNGSNTIGLTNLNMPLATTNPSASTLTFKNAITNINLLDSKASGDVINTLIVASGSTSVANTTDGTIFNLTFNDNGANQAKSFTLTGGNNTINQVLVNSSDTGTNTLSVTGGSTTIDTINASNNNFTLALSSDSNVASNTLVTINSRVNGGNVTFSNGINPADQVHFSTLLLKGATNTIDSVTTSATNAKLVMQNSATADIANLAFGSNGGSILFGFEGIGNSTITLGNGTDNIEIGDKQTLGISIGGSGTRDIKVVGKNNSSITFGTGSTLVVDFQKTKKDDNITATLGSDQQVFTIGSGSQSIINLYGGEGQSQLNGSITLSDGTNTINFLDTATMGDNVIALSRGTNIINVYGAESADKAITGTMGVSQIGSVNNTINLNDYSTLVFKNGNATGELKTTATNTLNFLGNNATLQGGFGVDGTGTATINVGTDSTKTGISGLITGNVSGAGIVFKGTLANNDSSKLTLQGETNTISSLTTSSTNGILVLDASKNAVGVDVNNASGMTIDANKSITIALHSTKTSNNNATFGVTTGGITVNGTLGIAISGDGEGARTISASSGGITFNSGSTLRVDFLENSAGSATFEGANLTISSGRKSEINFYAGSTAELAGGGLLIQDGGTNTVNFYGNAKLAQVAFEGGTNNINVFDNVTATVDIAGDDNSKIGNATNTIDLKEGATLVVVDGTTPNASILSLGKNNTLNFSGANATLQGGFGLDGGAGAGVSASINVKNTGAVIKGNVTNAGVNFSDVNGSTLTLQGATNTLNALSSTANITGTIILDATLNNSVSAEITTPVANNSSVGLKFGAGDREKTFKFSASGNNLSGVEFDESGSTNNTLSFTSTGNAISNSFVIAQGQGLIIDLQNNSDLSIAGLSSTGNGVANLQSTGTATLKGGNVNVANLSLLDTTSNALTLQNSNTTINLLSASGATSNTLKLDASSNAVNTTIGNTLNGNNLTITLAGADATKTATLNLNGANNTISNLTLGTSSANNTLALNKGKTTISSDVSVASGQGMSFNLANGTTLEFGGINAFTNSAGTATFNIQGANTTLDGAINANGGTTTLSMIDGSSLTLADGLSTTGGATAINFVGTSSISGNITTTTTGTATTSIVLLGEASGSISGNITTTGTNANTTINYSAGNATLTLKNGTQTISTLTLANNTTSTLNLSNQANTTISNALTLDNSKNLNVNIDGNSSLNLASVSTTSGALNVNADGSLSGSLTLAGLTNEDQNNTVNNTINVSTFTLNGNLSVNRGATNTIKANSITLSGNVITKNQGEKTKNTFITNSIEFATSSSVYTGDTGGMATANLFDISGNTNFSNKNLAIITNNNYKNEYNKLTLFKFGGEVSGSIAELTSTALSGTTLSQTKSVLSFEGSTPQSLTITDINKASTLSTQNNAQGKVYADGKSGNIYIGKNLTSGSGEALALNSAFNDSNWSDATYQASNLTLTIQNLNTNGGKNYINVGALNVGDGATSGSISASDGGVNNIALGKDSKIKGNITSSGGENNIVIQGSNATLTLEGNDSNGTNHAITTLNASGENTTLVLDNSGVTSGAMTTTISTLNGANLTATLKGKGTGNEATLALNGGALKALTLGGGSTGNILDLSNATDMSITNQVNVGKDQDLTIKLKNTTLALNGGLNTNGGTSTIALEGTDSASATLTGGAIALSNLTLGATDSNTLNISSSSAVIDSITASGSTSNTLALNNTRATITSAINVSNGGSGNPLSLEVNNSTLIFGSSDNTITSLSSNGGLVDLSQGVKPQTPYVMARGIALASNGASARNTLTINNELTGTATFKLYASKTESDRVVINGTSSNPSQAIISITGGNDVFSITESDNVVVATRTDSSVAIVGGESYIGGAKVGVTIGAKSDDENAFIIKNAIELEADPVYQEVASSALAVNYDLYLANFNSLNKRMGELRNTQDSNGVWARVFGGAMSNDFGAGSKTNYVTAQAGYDYSLSVGDNARNFIGIAVAYGTSDTKGNASYASSSNNAGLSLDKVSSNMVEVGLYNSYVADNGWYNDTILKFDYIMSDFSLSNDPSTMSSTSNFAMVLSDEFGYRYSFGVSEKGSWYIDPQAEFAFGYFNQSDFNRAVDSLTNIKASQDAILTLRSRVGATLGKKFNTEKGFASLYVGASYEYDYIEGGSSGVSTRDGGLITQLDKVESNGRAVLNVGSNIELTKGARLYIDVEKSFGDKQRTFMQFNLGARYSF